MKIFKAVTGLQYMCSDKCCLFCKHCSDVYWDYTNGPYMMICAADHEETLGYHAKCEYFEEGDRDDRG